MSGCNGTIHNHTPRDNTYVQVNLGQLITDIQIGSPFYDVDDKTELGIIREIHKSDEGFVYVTIELNEEGKKLTFRNVLHNI